MRSLRLGGFLALGYLCAATAMAKDDDRQEQIRRLTGDRTDPHCAAEGPGFVYMPEARACVRIGGLVGVQGGLMSGSSRP